MNKSELVDQIARRQELEPAVVARVIDGFIDVVSRSVVRGEKVVLSGFGTFHRRARGRRTARNVWTNQPVTVPARNVPMFRPGKPFREAVGRRRGRRTPPVEDATTATGARRVAWPGGAGKVVRPATKRTTSATR